MADDPPPAEVVEVSDATFVAEVISFCGEERYTEFIVGESVETLRFGGVDWEFSIQETAGPRDVSVNIFYFLGERRILL